MLKIKNRSVAYFARAGCIGALYAVLTLVFYPISFGVVQVRISEVLTILPLFYGEAVWGLLIGCLISNLFGNGVIDVVFGTLATFVAGGLTFFIGKAIRQKHLKFFIGALPPIILNAIIVPFTFLALTELSSLYFISAIQILIGQLVSVLGGGGFFYYTLIRVFKNKKRS